MRIFSYIGSIIYMLKDKDVSWWKKLLVIFGIVYFVSPIEILPDFLLPIGFIDDIILWVMILVLINNSLKVNYKDGKEFSKKFKNKDIIETDDYQVEE